MLRFSFLFLVLLINCTLQKSESNVKINFLDKNNKKVKSIYKGDIINIVDTTYTFIQFKKESIEELKNYGDQLIYGKIVFYFGKEDSVSLDIIDSYLQLYIPCPHIIANTKGIIFIQDTLVIQNSHLKVNEKCRDTSTKFHWIIKNIKLNF